MENVTFISDKGDFRMIDWGFSVGYDGREVRTGDM